MFAKFKSMIIQYKNGLQLLRSNMKTVKTLKQELSTDKSRFNRLTRSEFWMVRKNQLLIKIKLLDT